LIQVSLLATQGKLDPEQKGIIKDILLLENDLAKVMREPVVSSSQMFSVDNHRRQLSLSSRLRLQGARPPSTGQFQM